MKNALMINFEKRKIVMTRQFAKKCTDTRSPEYAHLQSVRRDSPEYEVTTRQIKKKNGKKSYKDLTYSYMRDYIILHTAPEEEIAALAEFDELILISKCQQQSLRYPTIKKWFLNKYPEVAKFGTSAFMLSEQSNESISQNARTMPATSQEEVPENALATAV